jgi:hypothetical protein
MWIGIVYAILALILVGFGIVGIVYGAGGIAVGGFGGTSVIMLFVFGIILFYQFLKVGFSCSISRKTVFLSLLIAGLVFAIVTGIGNILLALLMELFPKFQTEVFFEYSDSYSQSDTLPMIVSATSLNIALGVASMFFGYFVGVLYYRMTPALRVIVSVGTGVLMLFGLPLAISAMSEETLMSIFGWVFALGSFVSVSPYNLSLLLVAGAVVLVLLFWLLVRRAPVKEK